MLIIKKTLTTSLSHTPYTSCFPESSVYVTSIYLIDTQAIPSGSDNSSSIGFIVLESPLRYSSGYRSGLVPVVISVLWVSPILSVIRPDFTRHPGSLTSTRVVTESWLSCRFWLTESLRPLLGSICSTHPYRFIRPWRFICLYFAVSHSSAQSLNRYRSSLPPPVISNLYTLPVYIGNRLHFTRLSVFTNYRSTVFRRVTFCLIMRVKIEFINDSTSLAALELSDLVFIIEEPRYNVGIAHGVDKL